MNQAIPAFEYKISLGQNFIFDPKIHHHLIDLCGLGAQDAVFEIGAGRGDLTQALSQRCRQVVSLEIDPRLESVLSDRLAPYPHARLVMGDVMKTDLVSLLKDLGPFHVVANLPYYLTTPILERLFHAPLPIEGIHVMVQEEAAHRVLAKPGESAYGPLAVLAQYKSEPRIAYHLSRRAFTPPPKVDSVFLVMPMRRQPLATVEDEALFFRLVNAAFLMRRKTLVNNLMPAFQLTRQEAMDLLAQTGLSDKVRGEALSIHEFARLSNQIASRIRNKS